MLFNGTGASPETTPTAYNCDHEGDCELLDVQGDGRREYRRIEWDGEQWVNEQRVAMVKACTGPACGYNGGGASSNVAGVLDDGTLLLQAIATDGSATIYLVQ